MEQKFKVGDLVRSKAEDNSKGRTGKVTGYGDSGRLIVDFGEGFLGHGAWVSDTARTLWFLDLENAELAYPSDHDLLDYAARDSKIAELTAKVSELEAELEKWKPKPESMTRELALCRYSDTELRLCIGHVGDTFHGEILARKTVTITEGEGM